MPTYQNEIVIIIRADLLEWQKLDAAAFLASAVERKTIRKSGGRFCEQELVMPMAKSRIRQRLVDLHRLDREFPATYLGPQTRAGTC
jgi:hypothetical protein